MAGTMTKDQILDGIAELSVLELSELSKTLQEVFGVSAAAPVYAGGPLLEDWIKPLPAPAVSDRNAPANSPKPLRLLENPNGKSSKKRSRSIGFREAHKGAPTNRAGTPTPSI